MRSMRGTVQGRDTSVRGIICKGRFVQGPQHPRTFGRAHIGRGHINPAQWRWMIMRLLYYASLWFITVITRPWVDMSHGRRLPSLIHPDLDHGRIVTALSHWTTDEKTLFPKHFGQSFSNFKNHPCISPPVHGLPKRIAHTLTQIMSTHLHMYMDLKK
jgi:hypothetical protein